MTKTRLAAILVGAAAVPGFSGTATALDLGVFGDISIVKQEGRDAQFRIGHLDFFVFEDIDDKTRVFLEMELQTQAEGTETPRGFDFEVQRYWIMRDFTGSFSLGAGRFHTPIGYWSRQFHHGKLMKPTVTRPFIVGFEGSRASFIPMHIVGLFAEGELGGGFHYEAAIANSNSIDTSLGAHTLEVPNRTDRSSDKSVFVRLSHDVLRTPFKPGISVMWNDVNENARGGGGGGGGDAGGGGQNQSGSAFDLARGDRLVRQRLIGADLRYEQGRFGFLGEAYWLENDSQPGVGDGGKYTATAWFAQFSYRLTEKIQATYRYESLDFDDRDPYFTDPNLLGRTSGGDEDRNVFALRYDFHESNAVKFEVSERPRPRGGDPERIHFLSWEFVIF